MTMPWVPIHESGVGFSFGASFCGEGVAAAEMTDSTVTYQREIEASQSCAHWGVEFTGERPARVRITATNYLAGTDQQGNVYDPGHFEMTPDVGAGTIVYNTEPPAPDSNYPDNSGVVAFQPVVFDAADFGSPLFDLQYTPTFTGGGEWEDDWQFSFLIEVWQEDPVDECISYNCECEGEDSTRKVETLAALRRRMLVRMGYVANADNPPPGKAEECDDYLRQAQEYLYNNVAGFRQSRFYRWPLQEGVRFYGFDQNDDECPKKMQPELVEWVGVSDGPCDSGERWRQLACGINPQLYDGGIHNTWPMRYEFRECIELWPAPDARGGFLRIKAKFGLQPFVQGTDTTTIDPELVFMLALANMRSDYNKPGADKYAQMVQNRIGALNAEQHHTRRYHPDSVANFQRATDPRPKDGWLP